MTPHKTEAQQAAQALHEACDRVEDIRITLGTHFLVVELEFYPPAYKDGETAVGVEYHAYLHDYMRHFEGSSYTPADCYWRIQRILDGRMDEELTNYLLKHHEPVGFDTTTIDQWGIHKHPLCEWWEGETKKAAPQDNWQSVRQRLEAQGWRVGQLCEGRADIELAGKCGFVDTDGQVVVPIQYDGAWRFSEGRAMVEQSGKWGFVDLDGRVVVPIQYDDVRPFREGRARVKKDGKVFWIGPDGSRLG